ncbi:C-type lectin 37Db-like [Drosophila nasuta]|uniref:C-type lectin 37Db-like n=1 Tax=Drosophila nasuta TaxID=42062 RepID=UPI00295E36DD|nr:C-type lectin 37Db-like [Drosophila nasuta]
MLWPKLIGFAVLSLLLAQLQFIPSDAAVSGCSDNFTQVAGKCLFAANYWYNWYQAERHCRSLGAGLFNLQNQTQLQQISDWLNATLPYTIEFWTSGNKLGQYVANYYWQNTGEQAHYLPWANGQPLAASGDCVTLFANYTYYEGILGYNLVVRNCTHPSPHVCEKQTQITDNRICLKTGSYENVQVLL